jgi:hypothetical protein
LFAGFNCLRFAGAADFFRRAGEIRFATSAVQPKSCHSYKPETYASLIPPSLSVTARLAVNW